VLHRHVSGSVLLGSGIKAELLAAGRRKCDARTDLAFAEPDPRPLAKLAVLEQIRLTRFGVFVFLLRGNLRNAGICEENPFVCR
jgi:hypothetical protein